MKISVLGQEERVVAEGRDTIAVTVDGTVTRYEQGLGIHPFDKVPRVFIAGAAAEHEHIQRVRDILFSECRRSQCRRGVVAAERLRKVSRVRTVPQISGGGTSLQRRRGGVPQEVGIVVGRQARALPEEASAVDTLSDQVLGEALSDPGAPFNVQRLGGTAGPDTHVAPKMVDDRRGFLRDVPREEDTAFEISFQIV